MHRKLAIAAMGVAIGLVGSNAAKAEDQAERIARLEARLAQLEAQLTDTQDKTEKALAQSRAIDAAILDAERRAQFLQAGSFTAGWDNGFQLQSADGNYVFQPTVDFQFRYVNNSSGGILDDDADIQDGFENRRERFGVKGNLFTPELTYNFRLTVNRSGGGAILDNAYAQYQFADHWALRFGQFKGDVYREETISATRQLAADRSLVNEILAGGQTDYVQGVALVYEADKVSGEVAFIDGDDSDNTNYTNVQTNFGVLARLNYLAMGKWSDFNDFTASKTKQEVVVLGAGAGFSQSGDADVYRATVDVMYKRANGFAAFGALMVNHTTPDGAVLPPEEEGTDYGALLQASYATSSDRTWEPFARYSAARLDAAVDGEDLFHEFTIGVNKYFRGHNAKLTLDVGYLPNGSPVGASGIGVTNTVEEQLVIRGQFQLTL